MVSCDTLISHTLTTKPEHFFGKVPAKENKKTAFIAVAKPVTLLAEMEAALKATTFWRGLTTIEARKAQKHMNVLLLAHGVEEVRRHRTFPLLVTKYFKETCNARQTQDYSHRNKATK